MKKWLIIFWFLAASLTANIQITFDSAAQSEEIRTTEIGEIAYFNINELDKIFKASISSDLLEQRLYIYMYEAQITILLDSSYLLFMGEIYNFQHPLLLQEQKYYLPTNFITEILPDLFPAKINSSGNLIQATVPQDNSIRRIVIDPGHGGKDPGAVGYSRKTYEKDITLKVAQKLKNHLEKNLEVEVYLTRSRDEFISLQARTEFANQNEADLFISLHCNAHRNSKAKGVEVYYLSTATTDEARAVEALENSVVYDFEGGEAAVQQYNDLEFILADMAQNEHLEESYKLSTYLQDNLVLKTQNYDRGVKQANFYVLRGAYMPAVLIEIGFLSNPEDEKKLKTEQYQNKVVQSIYESVKLFKLKYDTML
ncbi:MAG: N-acetylmuramoyl-L-alanine amidase [Candidatus Cloacimonadales bacterium]